MKRTPQIYLLTLNAPSRRALRLWTGKSIHTLRHCSAKQVGLALTEMRKSIDGLQNGTRARRHAKAQAVSA